MKFPMSKINQKKNSQKHWLKTEQLGWCKCKTICGIKIGKTFIGAGSVVTKSVKNNTWYLKSSVCKK